MAGSLDRDFVWLRWALTLALAYLILVGEGGSAAGGGLAYVALLLASNVALGRGRSLDPRFILVVDSAFLVAGLFFYDGVTQDLLIASFLCILMAALTRSEHALAGAAFLLVGAYAGWMLQAAGATSSWIRLPFLFVATVFYGYLMQRVRTERAGRVAAEEKMRSLDALLGVTRSFSSSLATGAILDRVGQTLRDALGARLCGIRLVTTGGRETLEPEVVEALTRRETVCGRLLALPIVYENELLGALVVERDAPAFAPDEIALCEIVAQAAAPALHNARRYESLAEAERRKSEFLIRLSHELRTPLTTIRLCSEMLLEEAARTAPLGMRASLERMSRALADLSGHIEILTKESREELGTDLVRLEKIDLGRLVEDCLHKATATPDRPPVVCDVDIQAGADEIYADRSRLERILDPLFWSIVRYSPDSRLRISAAVAPPPLSIPPGRPWERLLSLSIQDRGPRPQATSAARQHPATRRDAAVAASVDLSRGLLRALRGSIEVESVPNDGSRLHLRLPVEIRARAT